jgi:hypothetical protein
MISNGKPLVFEDEAPLRVESQVTVVMASVLLQ